MLERELCAPQRVSVRSWLRQPLCECPATPLRRKGSFSVCINTFILISFNGIAQAAIRSRIRFELTVAPSFRSVQLWTVRVHAPFKRVGPVRLGDLTISVCEEASSAAKMPTCSRPTVRFFFFLRSFSAAVLRRSTLLPVCPTSAPNSLEMP